MYFEHIKGFITYVGYIEMFFYFYFIEYYTECIQYVPILIAQNNKW